MAQNVVGGRRRGTVLLVERVEEHPKYALGDGAEGHACQGRAAVDGRQPGAAQTGCGAVPTR
ncbi:hypothetical protein ABK046_09510 [Streptomyces caeruleatus]